MQNLRFILSLVCIVSFGAAIAAKKNDNASAEQLILAIGAERADDKRTDEQIIGELKGLLTNIDVNAQTANGWTALMAAAKKGSLALVDYLVVNGADIGKKGVDGQGASDIAVLWKHDDIVSYIAAIDQFKKGGWTALDFGNSGLVKLFVEKKKFDVNAKDNSGKTVLMYAVEKGGKDLIAYLVEQGANINAVNNDGKTALMLAVQGHASEFVNYLLGNGADPDIKDKTGKTALMNAILAKISEKIVPLDDALIALIPKSTNLDLPIPGQEGRTVLMEAAKYGWKHIVKSLLENGANVNAVDENGNTPLIYAVRYGENVGSPNVFNDRPDFLPVVDLLIAYHANLDARNNSGQTALIEVSKGAISRRASLLQEPLLEKGADPDIQDNGGKTALMWAAVDKIEGLYLIGPLKAIVEVGADLDITDNNGKTALVIAQEAGNVEAAEYLKKMGNDLVHKQKVAERKKRKQEKKEAGLLLAEQKEQERLEKIATAQAEQRRVDAERRRVEQDGQEVLKKLVEALKIISDGFARA